ncbi:MAG: hypothetical protein WBY94_07970 [Polyangiaceae bacterium]
MLLRSSLVIVSAASATWTSLLACNATGPGPTAPLTSALLDAGAQGATSDGAQGATSDAASDAQTGAFFRCTFDSDCVAVAKNSCCDDGFKEAVNQAFVAEYKASFTCTMKQTCPTFSVVDARVPHCARDTHQCELLRPDGGRSLPAPL